MRPQTALAVIAITACGGGVRAAEDPAFGKDLLATIALHGLPCDKVTAAKRNGDSDYTVSCHDGNRYHVFVDATGRVVVQKL